MGFGSFLARPFKDINKAVKKVGGGVSKAVKKTGGAVTKAVTGGSKSVGPSDKLKKKVMPGKVKMGGADY